MKSRIEAIMDPNNWEPNFTEIAKQTGLSNNAVREWYAKQTKKGLIVKERHTNSIIRIKNISEIAAMEGKNE